MQRYKVIGADRQTGEYSEVVIEATSKSDAGKRSGLMVQMIELVPEIKAIAPSTPQAGRSTAMRREWDTYDFAGVLLVGVGWSGIALSWILLAFGVVRYVKSVDVEPTLALGETLSSGVSLFFSSGVLLGLGCIIRILRPSPGSGR